MHKYLYILSAEEPFSETDVNRIEEEICRLFECTGITVEGGTQFTIHSPLGPEAVDVVAAELAKRFRIECRAGGKVE
jgi:hypothetical protein